MNARQRRIARRRLDRKANEIAKDIGVDWYLARMIAAIEERPLRNKDNI